MFIWKYFQTRKNIGHFFFFLCFTYGAWWLQDSTTPGWLFLLSSDRQRRRDVKQKQRKKEKQYNICSTFWEASNPLHSALGKVCTLLGDLCPGFFAMAQVFTGFWISHRCHLWDQKRPQQGARVSLRILHSVFSPGMTWGWQDSRESLQLWHLSLLASLSNIRRRKEPANEQWNQGCNNKRRRKTY